MINQLIKSLNFEFLSKTYLQLSSSVRKTLQERLHSQTFYQCLKSKASSYCMAKDWNCTSSQKVCPCSLQFKQNEILPHKSPKINQNFIVLSEEAMHGSWVSLKVFGRKWVLETLSTCNGIWLLMYMHKMLGIDSIKMHVTRCLLLQIVNIAGQKTEQRALWWKR